MTGRVAILIGIAALALASRVAIPVGPVPITLQTLIVTLLGALCGPRAAIVAILIWLGAGLAGLPVLAGGSSGLAKLVGPTGGYLVAFPLAGWLVGVLAVRGWMQSFALALAAMLVGNALCLALGAAWLAALHGTGALASGVVPFLPGALAKSLAGAAIARALQRLAPGDQRQYDADQR